MLQTVKYIINEESHGKGRPMVILHFSGSAFEAAARELYNSLENSGQIHLISIKHFSDDWQIALDTLLQFLEQKGIRNASFAGFEDCTVLLQALILKRPKLVRSLILIDPATRARPTAFQEWISRVEHLLPLGLPFRSEIEGFDAEPFLQRIRCPLLLVLASKTDAYKKEQLEKISQRAPTSFFVEIDASHPLEFNRKLHDSILQFFEIPAKSPQKNIGK